MRSRWLRRGPIEVGVACGETIHRVRCDGDALVLLDHAGDDADAVLAALGGAPHGGCLAIRDAWLDGRRDDLPPALRSLATERWRRAGVAPSALAAFLAAADRPAPALVALMDAHPAVEAARWWEALGERPTPERLRPFADLGVAAAEAVAWREALGRPVRPSDVTSARTDGVESGFEAQLWAAATGEIPSTRSLERWHAIDVPDASVAVWWAELAGRPVTAVDVAALREQGIDDPERALAERRA